MDNEILSFLALGDSYTIGEAVEVHERWPMQLVQKLRSDDIAINNPKIIATTGWTTDELLTATERVRETFEIVTLLIGVNNQYRGYPIEQYEKEFEELLNKSVRYAAGMSENVFVISIPDYGFTPYAVKEGLSSEKVASELDTYNEMAERITRSKRAAFIDLTNESREAKGDPALIAKDGLHPSAKMYTKWVESMYITIYDNLSTR